MLDKRKIFALVSVFVFLLILPVSYAHVINEENGTLDEYIKSSSVMYAITAAVIVSLITVFAVLKKKKGKKTKWILFLSIVIPVVLASAYMAGGTIYLNLVSESGGLVHWHADFEIWNCGESVDLIDPDGLLNRVGTSVLHEHGDNRIHIEGVIVDFPDASLHSFFNVVGGSMSDSSLIVPTNEGSVRMVNGDTCNGEEGKLQVFLYRVQNPDDLKNWEFTQSKLDASVFPEYIPAPYSNIPPGDCVIIEFSEEKERTDEICETMKIAIDKSELREAI